MTAGVAGTAFTNAAWQAMILFGFISGESQGLTRKHLFSSCVLFSLLKQTCWGQILGFYHLRLSMEHPMQVSMIAQIQREI